MEFCGTRSNWIFSFRYLRRDLRDVVWAICRRETLKSCTGLFDRTSSQDFAVVEKIQLVETMACVNKLAKLYVIRM